MNAYFQEGKCEMKNNDKPTLDEMVHKAEEGYDVDEIIRRRGGRPTLGNSPSTVESVRLDPELKRDLLLLAASRKISVSEAIRDALRNYVNAG